MRKEKDFLGEVQIPPGALYGIHSFRARNNFPDSSPFAKEWYQSVGSVKLACYRTVRKLLVALEKEHPDMVTELRLPGRPTLDALESAATQVASGAHFEHFIVPAVQGGAGTSINLNVNEIISNVALQSLESEAGDYEKIDPFEDANIFQSTNDVIPTALTVASMHLLNELEEEINQSRSVMEGLEQTYRNSLRLAYTQMQEAVPATFGQLFSSYSDALSRDWWRVSKAFERLKVVNLGGGATGTGISIPRFYIMEVVPVLKSLTSLPLTQGENLPDTTSNMDKWVEVHAILKAHAVNLEKMASDLRLLSSGTGHGEINLPERQVGSSIMPGKVNPVIPEYLISAARRIYANDQLVTSLAASGCLELNAYLPQIGDAFLSSLNLMIGMNRAFRKHMLEGLVVHEDVARERLLRSPSLCTALSPLIGYHRSAELGRHMKEQDCDIVEANARLGLLEKEKLEQVLQPSRLLKLGFTIQDIKDLR